MSNFGARGLFYGCSAGVPPVSLTISRPACVWAYLFPSFRKEGLREVLHALKRTVRTVISTNRGTRARRNLSASLLSEGGTEGGTSCAHASRAPRSWRGFGLCLSVAARVCSKSPAFACRLLGLRAPVVPPFALASSRGARCLRHKRNKTSRQHTGFGAEMDRHEDETVGPQYRICAKRVTIRGCSTVSGNGALQIKGHVS